MTENQIRSVIKKQLSFFNRAKADITDDTLAGEILTSDELNQQKLFKGNVLWSLWNAKHGKKKFPSGWLSLSVSELAAKLLLFIVLLISAPAFSQLKVNLSTVKTDLKENAIQFGFTYLRSLDSTFGGQEQMLYGKRSYFMVTPDIEFLTGNQDAFSSIIAKASGLFVKFRTTTVDGIETPDADKVLHVFPVSLGAETNNAFTFVNGLFEVGYTPFYQSATSKTPDWLKHTRFGAYLQAGKKFAAASADSLVGGEVDQSAEDIGEGILRAKGTFSIDTKTLFTISGLKVGVVGNSTGWYDFLNKQTYYKLEGIARIFLNQDTYFDAIYSRGSGAPNFNTGSQWGAGLTIVF